MTVERLIELATKYFGVSKADLLTSTHKKCPDDVAVAKHCMRGLAILEYNIPPKEFTAVTGIGHSAVSISLKAIRDGYYAEEYEGFSLFVKANYIPYEETTTDEEGIQRITMAAYDERFYADPKKANKRTGNNFFPAYHFVVAHGAPENIGLSNWKKDKGHFTDYILKRSQVIGSYVHDAIDMMIKYKFELTKAEIASNPAWHDASEVKRVYDCLKGFLSFMRDEEPQIISSEKMMCAEDFGFTLDLKCRLKSDDYKNVWIVDWKTSKSVNDDHKMQVSVMRKEVGADRAAVVVLGSKGKGGYTKTAIPVKDHDFWCKKFNAIKETAYVEFIKRGTIAPRVDDTPDVFSLKDINISRL